MFYESKRFRVIQESLSRMALTEYVDFEIYVSIGPGRLLISEHGQ